MTILHEVHGALGLAHSLAFHADYIHKEPVPESVLKGIRDLMEQVRLLIQAQPVERAPQWSAIPIRSSDADREPLTPYDKALDKAVREPGA